jgi:hypothetical protein
MDVMSNLRRWAKWAGAILLLLVLMFPLPASAT